MSASRTPSRGRVPSPEGTPAGTEMPAPRMLPAPRGEGGGSPSAGAAERAGGIALLAILDEKLCASLRSGVIKLLDADYLRNASVSGDIARRQDLEQREKQRRIKIFLPPNHAVAILKTNSRAVGALTYGWTARENPDTSGVYLAAVRRFLRSPLGRHIKAVFWDFASSPQKPRSAAEDSLFEQGLDVMADLYSSVLGTTVMRHRTIAPRNEADEGEAVIVVKADPDEGTRRTGFGGGVYNESELRRALGNGPLSTWWGAIESVTNEEGRTWRVRFSSRAALEAACTAPAPGIEAILPAYNERPYDTRGWGRFESAVCFEALARVGKNEEEVRVTLSRLPPKLVEIDGYNPHASTETGVSVLEDAEARTERVRASIFTATFSYTGDKAIVTRLYNNFVDSIGEAMIDSSWRYLGERNADGQMEGKGSYHFPNGDVYDGMWKANQPDGYGIFRTEMEVYEGEFKEGKKQGKGTHRLADGAVYEGEWSSDVREGRGRFRFADGSTYDGEFRAGQIMGFGTQRYADGTVYEGERNGSGQYEGRGKCHHANGDVYEGEYKNGEQEGRGTYHAADGTIYDGEWKEGQPDGRGTYQFSDGGIVVGHYKHGAHVGEGVRWSDDQKEAWKMQNGQVQSPISQKKARKIAKAVWGNDLQVL